MEAICVCWNAWVTADAWTLTVWRSNSVWPSCRIVFVKEIWRTAPVCCLPRFSFCFYINRDDSHQGFGLFEDFDLVEFNVPNRKYYLKKTQNISNISKTWSQKWMPFCKCFVMQKHTFHVYKVWSLTVAKQSP